MREYLRLLYAALGFAAGLLSSAYLKTMSEAAYVAGFSSLLAGVAPYLYPASAIAASWLGIMLAYSAWRLSMASRGFRRAAIAASGGFGAFLAYLAIVDEAFRRARLLLLPLAVTLFILSLIAAILMRLNSGGGARHGRRRGKVQRGRAGS